MSGAKSEITTLRIKQEQSASDDSGNFTASVFTEGDGSHVTLLSPRINPASSVTAMTEDGCHTSAVSLSEYLTAPSSPRNQAEAGESYLRAIFDNFNELYHDKIAWIDENIPGGDSHAHVMAKKNVLEHWVKDVIEQNNILVQTVEELEAEAEKKVQNLQKKVQDAAEMAKEHMGMIKEYEEQVKHLMKEKHIVEKQEEFFRKESMYLEKEKRRALDRLRALETDNTSLVALLNRIRDMGVWDVNGLEFAPRTYDSIFGLYPTLPGSEVQTVFTREKTRSLEKAEHNIAQLTAQVEELHDRKNEAERLLTEKTKVTEELQNDIKELHSKIKQYQDEHLEFKKSLQETQEQLKAATLKNQSRPSTVDTKRDSEMKKMLAELRDLRNQLNIACTERQQAMKESNALKMDLRGRISQMEEMKQLLEQLQTESASTRSAVQNVQDKQDQMSSLKEKVTFYQTSYENSNVLLEAKSEIIVKLQNQMDQLHDKVTRLEQSRSCSPKPVAIPHARSLSPSPPPLRRTSRPASHPASRPNSQPSTHATTTAAATSATPVPAISSSKKLKVKDATRKPGVKVKKSVVVPKPSKTDAKTHNSQEAKKNGSSSVSKPPWNDHFLRTLKKPLSPRPTSDKTKSLRMSKYNSESKSAGASKLSQKPVDSGSCQTNVNSEHLDEKRVFSDTSKLYPVVASTDSPHTSVNRIIADYLGQSDSGKPSSNGDKTTPKRVVERIKLPPIPTKSDTTTSPHASPSKPYEKTTQDEHLPRIVVKEKKAHTSHNLETLENLMEVCVKASRELNKPCDADGNKSTPKYRVVTGHSHRRRSHRSRENTYTVEAVPKNKSKAETGGGGGGGGILTKGVTLSSRNAEDKPTKVKPGPKVKGSKPAESDSESISDISQFRRVAIHPTHKSPNNNAPPPEGKSPESILAELPKVSQEYLVKKWIVSSPVPAKKLRKPRSSSPDKSDSHPHRTSCPERTWPDSRGKSKSSGPINLLAVDDWSRKQEATHSDATGDRDSGHLSDFSDWWNWNGNDDEPMDKEVQQNSEMSGVSELSTYESIGSPHREVERIQQLIAENQRLREQNSKLEQLNECVRNEKETREEAHKKELEQKEVEITMQKLPGLLCDEGKGVLGLDGDIFQLSQFFASFENKVKEVVEDLRKLKNLTAQLNYQTRTMEKDELLLRSYNLLNQLERERQDYVVGDCPEYSLMVEDGKDGAILSSRFPEELRRLQEIVKTLHAQMTLNLSSVEAIQTEFIALKSKVEFATKSFRGIISDAQKENNRLMSVVDKLEKKQVQMDEVLLMESEMHRFQDDVAGYDCGFLLTEKRLGVIQQSYDKLSQELLRRDELIVRRDSKIAELEKYVKDYEAFHQSKDSSSSDFTQLGMVLPADNGTPSSSEVEKIQRLIWLTAALRKKLKRKKEREASFQQEKEIILRLAATITSTWDSVRHAYDQLRAENLYLKSKCESLASPPPQTVESYPAMQTYVEEGGGDDCGNCGGPALISSSPYSSNVSGASALCPSQTAGPRAGVPCARIDFPNPSCDSCCCYFTPTGGNHPTPPSYEESQEYKVSESIDESSVGPQYAPCSMDNDACRGLQRIVQVLEECHARIRQEISLHT